MATANVSRAQFDELQKVHSNAMASLKRSRQVMRALRNLTESKLEKSLVAAGNEAMEAAFTAVNAIGPKLRHMSDKLKAAESQEQSEVQ